MQSEVITINRHISQNPKSAQPFIHVRFMRSTAQPITPITIDIFQVLFNNLSFYDTDHLLTFYFFLPSYRNMKSDQQLNSITPPSFMIFIIPIIEDAHFNKNRLNTYLYQGFQI